MRKSFNVNGICYPDEHYMVNIDNRLEKIRYLVDNGKYFVINRARQYGKTTTLTLLSQKIVNQYQVFFISFEGLGDAAYASEKAFCRRVCGLLYDTIYYGETNGVTDQIQEDCHLMSLAYADVDLRILANFISRICKEANRPVVLIIDEVDQASGQEIFLSFLGMLRDKYMKRRSRPTFHSVILSSVYDIKNLKWKMQKGAQPQYNSPWNIAETFTVDMRFSKDDIRGMLEEYKQDLNAEMDTEQIARIIYDYTKGYPFLVSRLCQLTDEACIGHHVLWTKSHILKAVKTLLEEQNTLFDDMNKKLADSPELDQMLRSILFNGKRIPYSPDDHATMTGTIFGYLEHEDGIVTVSNRIFETRLYDRYLSESIKKSVDPAIITLKHGPEIWAEQMSWWIMAGNNM